MTQAQLATAEEKPPLPWKLFAAVAIAFVVTLGIFATAIFRDARFQAAMDQVQRELEAEGRARKPPVPVKAAPAATAVPEKPFSADEAEREMAERERAARAKVEADMARRDDASRRKMERENLDYAREKAREAAELRARRAAHIP
jgi:hypothetical protein